VALPADGAGWLDVAALIRQVLLEHQARHGTTARLTVPAEAPFAMIQQWGDAGCQAIPAGTRKLSVAAEPWHPPTGAGEPAEAVAEDIRRVYRGEEKAPQNCPADPFWTKALGARFSTYKSLAQRQAARTVMLATPGSTSIVCLPTGQGKTEVALAPALFASRFSGVSVLVVPTIVLAFDHERRIQNLLAESEGRPSPSGRYAYTSGTSEAVKEQIRDAIRAGTQRVVVASPEAVEQGLSGCLTAAASEGRLQHLILDEAHLVDQWGSAFRPEFQTLASQRLAWLDVAPPGREVITVAMSATLTSRHITTLTRLFGPGPQGDFALTWASVTRPEPSYYLTVAEDRDTRDAAIVTAVARLPRPLVLYASTRADVSDWADRLRAAGLRRVGVVKGDSDEEERREALEGWRGERATGEQIATRYDIVVGTSAFGLGIDMPNVRTVLHACLPETIDRYYQEVGRSGRDGKPSIAYLVKAPSDDRVARNLNQVTTIGEELGWSRWSRMLNSARRSEADAYEIDLASVPRHLAAGYRQSRQWNVRTLNLMAWAGLIRTRATEPPQPRPDEDDEEFAGRREEFYENARTRIAVEFLSGAASNRELWTKAIEAEREKVAEEQYASLQRMHDGLRGKRCVSELIAEHYRVNWSGGTLRTAINCRGCPACRARLGDAVTEDQVPRMYRAARDPHPPVRSWPGRSEDPLAKVRGGSPWLSLTWQTRDDFDDYLRDLLAGLAARGMPILGGLGLDARLARRVQERAQFAPVVTDHDEALLKSYPNWIIWVLSDESDSLARAIRDRLAAGEPTYLVHHRGLSDPDRPGIALELVHPSISLRAALEAL
jgi:superfamily II DNA/RNA helicase